LGNPTSWSWTFEGGTPESFDGQNPPDITYSEAGDWDVTLVVSDGVNTDNLTVEDYIHTGIPPVAEFEAEQTEVTAGSYTNFTSLATGDNLTYQWFFEGATPDHSTDENPQEIYYLIMEWDWYDVTLVVENPYGIDSLTKEDYIEVVPESVRELTLTDKNVRLYPNPNNGVFTLSLPAGIEASLDVMDIHGVSVFKKELNGTETIDTAGLGQGFYILSILDVNSGNLVIKRLIVQ
jgi:PKD repeat protein